MNFLKTLDWKLHIALLPLYVLIAVVYTAIFFVAYCGLIQFGVWGPIVGVVALWFVGGIFYAATRNS
jgi:hypothetical protein